jgi:undecaprenyl-phosphate 4-deoxy-4-formamido-L-arabinose transferase
MDLSVVIPLYGSSATLDELFRRLVHVLDGTGLSYEIVLVDDGSPDNSWEMVQRLQQDYPLRVMAIQLMRNYGQHNALMCGFRHSRGEYVLTMDDDLQNPPEEIPKLIEAIKRDDLDLVYGAYGRKKHRFWRNLSSEAVNAFYRIVFKSSVRVTSFRIIRRSLLESIFSYSLNFTFVDGLLAWNTQRIGQVTVEHLPRTSGRSGYSLTKLMVLALNLFTNFSLLPLQLASGLGLLTAATGLLTAAYYFIQYLWANITVPGYASIIIAILVLGGVQLLTLGIIGEYLGRLHLNVNRKPQYFERQVLGGEVGAADFPATECRSARGAHPKAKDCGDSKPLSKNSEQ